MTVAAPAPPPPQVVRSTGVNVRKNGLQLVDVAKDANVPAGTFNCHNPDALEHTSDHCVRGHVPNVPTPESHVNPPTVSKAKKIATLPFNAPPLVTVIIRSTGTGSTGQHGTSILLLSEEEERDDERDKEDDGELLEEEGDDELVTTGTGDTDASDDSTDATDGFDIEDTDDRADGGPDGDDTTDFRDTTDDLIDSADNNDDSDFSDVGDTDAADKLDDSDLDDSEDTDTE